MANGLVLNVDTTKSEFQNPMVQLRQGDGNYQSLSVTVTSNGETFDLTGWVVSFMGTTAGSHKIIDTNVNIVNALQGTFIYTPTKAWGGDEGEFKNAYFKFVKSDETASGASFRVNVLNAVDLTDEEAKDYISVVDAMIDQVKTDMDSKLADTKKTLSDTQTQANTVQSNVNDLNTNVNQLKQQNNNIRTSDNTWTGNNTFTRQILGNLNIPSSPETDLNNLNLSGNYKITTSNLNIPSNMPNGAVISVFNFDTSFTYQIIKARYSYSSNSGKVDTWVRTKAINIWGDWRLYAMDDSVLHNTGNETAAGNKTFTGVTTFTQPIQGNLNGNAATATTANTANTANTATTANDPNAAKLSANNSFTGTNTFTGQTSFWFKQIQWTTGIMQGTWYIQRMGNWVNAKFDMSTNTGTGTTTLSLPVGYRPLSAFPRELEQGVGGINQNGTVFISTSYTGSNAMTFSYPTNDAWPAN